MGGKCLKCVAVAQLVMNLPAMPLHLIKLAVGVHDLAHLKSLQAQRRKQRGMAARAPHWVYTRNTPKRAADLLDGGSLFWIIKGVMRCRQLLVGFEEDVDDEGRRYCRIKVKRTIVPTAPVAFKPFQGWRYMEDERAPPDLSRGDTADMPADMAAELKRLGLL
jgi:hypothetical protein